MATAHPLSDSIVYIKTDFHIYKKNIKSNMVAQYQNPLPCVDNLSFICKDSLILLVNNTSIQLSSDFGKKIKMIYADPLRSHDAIVLSLPDTVVAKLSGLELYDLFTKKHSNPIYTWHEDENVFYIANFQGISQVYFLKILTSDSKYYIKKVIVRNE